MKTVVLAAAVLTLGACDFVKGGLSGGVVANQANMAAEGNQGAAPGGKPTGQGSTQVADAGVTSSRSLQAFSNNGAGAGGGKDPSGGFGDGAVAISEAMLIGSWTDNGNCGMAVQFLPDGTFRSFNGGGGDWELDGEMLFLSGQGGNTSLRLEASDARTILTTDPNGTRGRSTRC
ncbi:hypothetical protein RCO27_18165 [Sphingosinicella sp. LHD-64]|uniref:hypothetical protein n=1 Tax=Sphingosinicella sp. LHD-64 TaxID=3072139 RepID=UPI00280DA47F|nr:hypothetical protein [Sphingosinicella sp. LHD-64]MDQ8758156.1 hypothetical protein [Sphingosinicella sp. LHD-64]